jgi:O-methyltransferase
VFRLVPTVVLRAAAPLVLRHPVSGLATMRLYAYLDELNRTREIEGAVVEIGTHLAGTSTLAYRFLCQIGVERQYVCIDTFSGFVGHQFEKDVEVGVPTRHRDLFAQNSLALVRRLLKLYETEEIELIEADVCTMNLDELPNQVAVALIDVDLAIPIRASLDALYPRMVSGGVMLVDDCPEATSWVGARQEYLRWVGEHGLEPDFNFGFGRIVVP